MLDSVIRVNKKYYPQTLLDECKYEIKKTKMENLINDDLETSSFDIKLIVTLIMKLIMNLTVRQIIRLTMNLATNNWLKVKTVF